MRNMLEIKGKVNTAICYAKVIEEDAIEQIRTMCDYELTKDPHHARCSCRSRMYDWNNYDSN